MTDRRRSDRRSRAQPIARDRRATDRRSRDRRTASRIPLDLWVEEEKGNELYFRRTGNVSLGGIYFEQTIPHALGTRVKLRFSLPGSTDVMEAAGEIVNTPQVKDGLGMGLRFTEVSPAVLRALGRYLEENAE
ncbi:MAG: PilZ domain-containing protein [Deltaproteobacteria bacterium]|nr:PilZ domain-containing protein [Deltaproteobacteria bacterium]